MNTLAFVEQLHSVVVPKTSALLIYDRRLSKISGFKTFKKKFALAYPVTAGEELKSLKKFSFHTEQIFKKWKMAQRGSAIYVMGGGTLGDFGGFFASVFKRGCPLIHIPTTWLAAMDSAHGGKNGINIQNSKNQLGTIYPAMKIFLVKSILTSQPLIRAEEAAGEALKIALLDSATLWKKVSTQSTLLPPQLWKLLPDLIDAKMKVVQQDWLETLGLRANLNLGHSLGHVIESEMKWPHGKAIFYGLCFDLIFSYRKGFLKEKAFLQIISAPLMKSLFQSQEYLSLLRLSLPQVQEKLFQDKKMKYRRIHQTFVINPGDCKGITLSASEILEEFQRQQKLYRRWSHA